MTVREAEERRAAALHTFLFHRNMTLINSGDPAQVAEGERKLRGLDDFVERVRQGGFTHQCSDPKDESVEIKLIRAFKKGLLLHGRQYAARPKNWGFTAAQLKHRDQERCNLCGDSRLGRPDLVLHAHHIVHRSCGGSNNRRNLVVLCYDCHQKQHLDIVITMTGGEPEGIYEEPEVESVDVAEPEPCELPPVHANPSFDRELAMFVAGRGPDPRHPNQAVTAVSRVHDEPRVEKSSVNEIKAQVASPMVKYRPNPESLAVTKDEPANGFDGRFWVACVVFFVLFKACRLLTDEGLGATQSPEDVVQTTTPGVETNSRESENPGDTYLLQRPDELTDEQWAVAMARWLESHPEVNTQEGMAAMGELLREVFSEYPQNAAGATLDMALKRGQANAAAQAQAGLPSHCVDYTSVQFPASYGGRRIAYNYENVPLSTFLDVIADESNRQIIPADDVSRRVTACAVNVPWDYALDKVLADSGYGQTEYNASIHVFKR